MSSSANPYRGFRFPAEIISHAVWLYHCFSLSLRDVDLILAARGMIVSYESIRDWGIRFGRQVAKTLERRRPKPGDKWHLDEVFIRIRGTLHYLWRAVDQNGTVLDILVQKRRDTDAAKRFLRKLIKGQAEVPRVIVTDKLKSYAAAKRELLPQVEHRQSRYLNNRSRFRTNRHDDENGRCMGSNRHIRHSASCPPTAAFTLTFSFAVISPPPPNTAPSGRLPSAFGRT